MSSQTRWIAAAAFAAAAMSGLVLAQGAGAPPPQTPPPTGQTTQPPPTAGRGGQQGQRGAGQQGRQGAGGRRGGFTQFTRELAPQDVIVRGKSLYEANCAGCHAADLRGGPKGHEPAAIGHRAARQARRTGWRSRRPSTSAAHAGRRPTRWRSRNTSTASTRRWAGRAARRDAIPTGIELNVLVGDAEGGRGRFARAVLDVPFGHRRSQRHRRRSSRTRERCRTRGSAGRAAAFAGGRGGGGGAAIRPRSRWRTARKLEGTLVRKDDFLVILMLPDGTRKSIARNNGIPKVDVKDPSEAHKKMVLQLDDPDNKKMHDITAYLWTIK